MSLSNDFSQISDFNFHNIDFDNVGGWPAPIKIIVCVMVFSVVVGFGHQFYLEDMNRKQERAELKEEELKEQLRVNYTKSVNLEAYKKQMQQMKEQFSNLVKQLPEDTEVPGLLDDITFAARASGLQVEYIRMQKEVIGEFYIELPINIMVKGSYHDFGNFVSGTSALSRIVTLHNFSIESTGEDGKLTMTIVAKTYRYNNDGDRL